MRKAIAAFALLLLSLLGCATRPQVPAVLPVTVACTEDSADPGEVAFVVQTLLRDTMPLARLKAVYLDRIRTNPAGALQSAYCALMAAKAELEQIEDAGDDVRQALGMIDDAVRGLGL